MTKVFLIQIIKMGNSAADKIDEKDASTAEFVRNMTRAYVKGMTRFMFISPQIKEQIMKECE